jgi:hypothetical protein
MSNLTVSSDIDDLMQSADYAAAKTKLGVVQLPTWTYDPSLSGTPAPGFFQTSGSDPSAITQIIFNVTPKYGGFTLHNLFAALQNTFVLVMTKNTGEAYSWYITGGANFSGSVVSFNTSNADSDTDSLSGDYPVSFGPTPTTTPTIANILSVSGITPVADGTYTIVGPGGNGSITFVQGICTAFAPNS